MSGVIQLFVIAALLVACLHAAPAFDSARQVDRRSMAGYAAARLRHPNRYVRDSKQTDEDADWLMNLLQKKRDADSVRTGKSVDIRSNRNLDNEHDDDVELQERDYSAYGGIFIGSAGSSYPGKRADKETEKREDTELERMEKDYVDILFG